MRRARNLSLAHDRAIAPAVPLVVGGLVHVEVAGRLEVLELEAGGAFHDVTGRTIWALEDPVVALISFSILPKGGYLRPINTVQHGCAFSLTSKFEFTNCAL